MAHPLLTEALDLFALAEETGDENDIAWADANLSRVVAKLDWTIAHRDCDHAYGICQAPHVKGI